MKIPLCGPSLKSRSVELTSQQRVNLYPQVEKQDSKTNITLLNTPGTVLFATLTEAPTRGMIRTATDRLICVGGGNVDEVASDGTVTNRGTIGTTRGLVRMCDNGLEILITDQNKAYTLNLSTNVVAEVTDISTIMTSASLDPPVWCTFQDTYGIMVFPNSQRFCISANNDMTSWTATDFSTADTYADNIKACISHLGKLWLFGDRTTEIWWNSGASAFPFERYQGAEMQTGIIAPQSLSVIGDSLFWMGSNEQGQGQVYQSVGYQAQVVSDSDMHYIFRSMSTITDAEGWTYQQEGHVFYCLDFPFDDQSWVYDVTAGMWHRRAYLNPNTNALERQRGYVQVLYNQKDYVGDYSTGQIFELDLDTYTDNTQEIPRIWTGPHVHSDRKNMFIHSFELDMEHGVGLSTGQGSDPKAMLECSYDGGHTFDNEYWSDIGKQGKYSAQVKWDMLGSSKSWVPRVTISDPVKIVLISAHAEITKGY